MNEHENDGPEWVSVPREAGRLGMADLALEWVHRGQRVRAESGTQTFSGQVVFAGTDYVTIERVEDQVAVRLDRAIWTLESESGAGRDQSGDATSLKARLAELAASGEMVRLVVAEGRALVGSIAVVAADQVEIRQDHLTVLVPNDLIVAVVTTHRR